MWISKYVNVTIIAWHSQPWHGHLHHRKKTSHESSCSPWYSSSNEQTYCWWKMIEDIRLTRWQLIGSSSHDLQGVKFYRSQNFWTITIPWWDKSLSFSDCQLPLGCLARKWTQNCWFHPWCIVLLGNGHHQDNITCLGDRESKPKPSNMLKVLLEWEIPIWVNGMSMWWVLLQGARIPTHTQVSQKGRTFKQKKPCMNQSQCRDAPLTLYMYIYIYVYRSSLHQRRKTWKKVTHFREELL